MTRSKTVVVLTVTENESLPEWDLEKFEVTCVYPAVHAVSFDEIEAVNDAKGVALCAIGQRRNVPDVVEFEYVRKRA